ncbi:MAG: HAMP domain-containing sensor histidine kinase, partial [Jatrophihabitans sp.]
MLVTLLALVSATIGLVTVVSLRGFLIGRLDSSLNAAGGRSAQADDRAPDAGDADKQKGSNFLLAPGQASGTLGARIKAGKIDQAGVLDDDGMIRSVSASTVSALLTVPVDEKPHTFQVGSLGEFRVLAVRSPDGDLIITGLPLADIDRIIYRLIAIELAVAASAILAATVVGIVIVRRTLRPLQRVAETAERVSALPLSEGEVAITERIGAHEVDDRTEVGQVAGSVNRLLDHVADALNARQESEMKVRRFVADASHELRTPLAAIRGYAELTRRVGDAPPEISYAMQRVESEAARMTTMVEDLLLLARLDAGRELAHEPVDLTHLLLDVVSDAAASGPDHQWRMNLPDDPVMVTGDVDSLHQVFANLLANARVHTPTGTTVTVNLIASPPDTAVVTILDDGPGIAENVVATVFERFARGETSRSRATGSTGLGLAIVRAIVEAHHGTVKVT